MFQVPIKQVRYATNMVRLVTSAASRAVERTDRRFYPPMFHHSTDAAASSQTGDQAPTQKFCQ